jgi:hypothetical protein
VEHAPADPAANGEHIESPTVSLTLGSDASAEEVEPEASGAAIILFSGLQ